MNYIIDGYNLGFKISEIARRLNEGDTERAIPAILNIIRLALPQRHSRIIVVFDGKHGSGPAPQGYTDMQIKFSRKPQTADDIIRRFLRKLRNAGQWTVVSSDAEILFTARDMGAATIRSEELAGGLNRDPDVSAAAKENEIKYNPDNVDVDYWLKQFGADPES